MLSSNTPYTHTTQNKYYILDIKTIVIGTKGSWNQEIWLIFLMPHQFLFKSMNLQNHPYPTVFSQMLYYRIHCQSPHFNRQDFFISMSHISTWQSTDAYLHKFSLWELLTQLASQSWKQTYMPEYSSKKKRHPLLDLGTQNIKEISLEELWPFPQKI